MEGKVLIAPAIYEWNQDRSNYSIQHRGRFIGPDIPRSIEVDLERAKWMVKQEWCYVNPLDELIGCSK
jgi:hypothetical protein